MGRNFGLSLMGEEMEAQMTACPRAQAGYTGASPHSLSPGRLLQEPLTLTSPNTM